MRENILVKNEAWSRQPKVNLFRVGYRLIVKIHGNVQLQRGADVIRPALCRRGHGKNLSVRVLIAT